MDSSAGQLSDEVTSSRSGSRTLAGLAAAASLMILAAALDRGAYPTPDAYLYLGLSRSLVELGSYTNFGLVGDPPQVMVPPLYSSLLALVRLLTGGSVLALNAVGPLLLCAGTLLLARRFGSLGWSRSGVLAAAALVIGNRHLQSYAWSTLTDVPFLGALGVSGWLLLRTESRRLGAWFATGLVVAALLIGMRLAGVGAAAGVVLWLLLERRFRAAALVSAATALVLGAWYAYVGAMSSRAALTYAPLVAYEETSFVANFVRRVAQAVLATGRTAAPYLERVVGTDVATVLAAILGTALVGGSAVILLRCRPPGFRLVLALLAGHLAVVCSVNNYFQDRLAYPVYFLTAFVVADWLAGARVRGRSLRPVLVAAVVLHLAASGAGAVRDLTRQADLWSEPPISARRVESSGASRIEKEALLALHTVAGTAAARSAVRIQAASVRAFYYGPLVLPAPVGWKPLETSEELLAELSAAAAGGPVLVLVGPRGGLEQATNDLESAGALRRLAVPGQDLYTVFEYVRE